MTDGIKDDFTTEPVTEIRGIPMAPIFNGISGTHPQISGTAWGEDISLDGTPNAASSAPWDTHYPQD